MPDRRTVLVVVGGLAFTLVACIIGAILLAAIGKDVPDVVKELGVGALGALAGILARTATEPGPVQPVNVVNTTAAPVPVDPQPDQPGYQPDPQKDDQAAKAQRLAHAQEVLQNGAMTGRADASVFRSDMHRVARQAADLGAKVISPNQARVAEGMAPRNLRLKRAVPTCGNPPIG